MIGCAEPLFSTKALPRMLYSHSQVDLLCLSLGLSDQLSWRFLLALSLHISLHSNRLHGKPQIV